MKRYDAGLLNSYGGGSTEWWFDYIRSLLDGAHDYYEEELECQNRQLQETIYGLQEHIDDLQSKVDQYIMEQAGEDL